MKMMMAFLVSEVLVRQSIQLPPGIGSNVLLDVRAQRILDIGCGDGSSTVELYRRFPNADIYGIDYDQYCILQAKKRYRRFPIRFEYQDAVRTPYPSGYFDHIQLKNVICRSSSSMEILSECRRLLASSGVLSIHEDTLP